jgi:hypothetical protein
MKIRIIENPTEEDFIFYISSFFLSKKCAHVEDCGVRGILFLNYSTLRVLF